MSAGLFMARALPRWAVVYSLRPLVDDLVAFVPGVAARLLIYLKTRRLPPLIVTRWRISWGAMTLRL